MMTLLQAVYIDHCTSTAPLDVQLSHKASPAFRRTGVSGERGRLRTRISEVINASHSQRWAFRVQKSSLTRSTSRIPQGLCPAWCGMAEQQYGTLHHPCHRPSCAPRGYVRRVWGKQGPESDFGTTLPHQNRHAVTAYTN